MNFIVDLNNGSMGDMVINFFEELAKPLFTLGSTSISFISIITCIAVVIIAFIFSSVLRRILTKVYEKRGLEQGMQHALNRLLHYLIMAVSIYIAIDNLGISLSALAAVGGVLLVGIGFGLQDLAKDFISGIIILLERPIRKGDYIEIKNNCGTVKEIGLRSTVINTYDDIEILIPNGKLMNDIVVNKLYKHKKYRIRINVGVAYDSNPEQVRDVLISVAKAHPDVLENPTPIVFFEHFKEFSLDFRLMGWLDDARLEPRVKSDLHFAVDKAFREAGIDRPFPQMDVHMRENSNAS